MARVDIPVQKIKSHEALINPTETSSDSTNDHSFKNTGQERLHGENTGVGTVVLTIVSVPDNLRRTGDIVISVPAGGKFELETLPVEGFNQSGGIVHAMDTDTDLKLWLTKREG